MGRVPDDPCAIARSLGVLGERWTFLILREASRGAGRFSQFREALLDPFLQSKVARLGWHSHRGLLILR